MNRRFLLLAATLGVSSCASAWASDYASEPHAKEGNASFFQLHDSFLTRGKAAPIGILFLGDSITAGWSKAPEIWKAHYGAYQPANFGIPGDATHHVIWRIEHGELDNIHPAVVVLLLGTNNTAHFSGHEIAVADAKIVGLIREKIPGTKVLLLAIFPRGPHKNPNGTSDDGVHSMEVIRASNAELKSLDDGDHVRFLDIGGKFLGSDGKIDPALMPEGLHPNAAGYAIWAEAMQPLLNQMLGGWTKLPPDLADRIRKNRMNTGSRAGDQWMNTLPASITVEANVPYTSPEASDPRLTSLDVFRPTNPVGKLPIVIFVHGGGFSAGDKSSAILVENKAKFFPAHGFIFASINYRMAPEFTYPVPSQDTASAVAYIRRQAPSWGGDPDAIILLGHSAGAQLVVDLGTQESFLRRAGVPPSSIRGVVSVDTSLPDIPLAMAPDDKEQLAREQVEEVYGDDPARWAEASPVAHLQKGKLPPILLFHATDPASLSCRENLLFADKWRAFGGYAEVEGAREKDHSHLGRDIGTEGDWITNVVMAFIHRSLSKDSLSPSL